MNARPITLLTDYGLADEFVGVCHAVIAGIAPDARIIDLAHGVPPQDVTAGAVMLRRAVRFAAPGVHMAVVDPGVGGARRAVAVAAADDERWFVGPDNGLLWPALEAFGGPADAVEISATPVRLEPVSATFHGRDLFAPVTAHLALCAPLDELGEAIDPETLVHLDLPGATVTPGRIEATIVLVDGFGNLGLSADGGALAAAELPVGTAVDVAGADAVVTHTFGDAPAGAVVVLVESDGDLAVAVNGGSAAAVLGVAAGDPVTITGR